MYQQWQAVNDIESIKSSRNQYLKLGSTEADLVDDRVKGGFLFTGVVSAAIIPSSGVPSISFALLYLGSSLKLRKLFFAFSTVRAALLALLSPLCMFFAIFLASYSGKWTKFSCLQPRKVYRRRSEKIFLGIHERL